MTLIITDGMPTDEPGNVEIEANLLKVSSSVTESQLECISYIVAHFIKVLGLLKGHNTQHTGHMGQNFSN